MGWVTATKIGQSRPFYDSRKDDLTNGQRGYIWKLEKFLYRQTDPVLRKRCQDLITAAYQRFEHDRIRAHFSEVKYERA